MPSLSTANSAASDTGLLGDVPGPLVLRVCGTEHDGRLLRISARKCSIGSSERCTLRLRSPLVRPFHCLILRGKRGMMVKCWSADTLLNGGRFQDAVLRPGDRLTVGYVDLEVLTGESVPTDCGVPERSATADSSSVPAGQGAGELETVHQRLDQLAVQLAKAASEDGRPIAIADGGIEPTCEPSERDQMIIQVTEAREWAEEFKNQLEQARREHRQARDEWQHDRRQLEAELADRAKQLAQREKQYQHAVSDFQRQLQQTAADAARWREAAERIHADLKENRIPAASSAQASGRNSAAAPVPQASSASLVAVPPSHSGASADPEDSIESFVERLLRRVRGPTLRDAGAEDDGERGGESTQLTDDELVPHTLAPELATDLAAMREVANESARAAIRASVRRRSTHEALTKMMSAGLAIGSGVVLINAASHAKSAYPVAGACFVAGVYWATRSVLYIRYLIGSRRKSQRAFSATPEPTQD